MPFTHAFNSSPFLVLFRCYLGTHAQAIQYVKSMLLKKVNDLHLGLSWNVVLFFGFPAPAPQNRQPLIRFFLGI